MNGKRQLYHSAKHLFLCFINYENVNLLNKYSFLFCSSWLCRRLMVLNRGAVRGWLFGLGFHIIFQTWAGLRACFKLLLILYFRHPSISDEKNVIKKVYTRDRVATVKSDSMVFSFPQQQIYLVSHLKLFIDIFIMHVIADFWLIFCEALLFKMRQRIIVFFILWNYFIYFIKSFVDIVSAHK